ncbi:uncharacterized protein LOC110044219 isoform X2 [Orbicella faveolata]|uniref:uncharacterized protein LOC110044219 isoform X2 n=1 Tax=Orbicella faveolata TaxID=48498 RepID=UPI0009E39440|nr:uncharacterized protein LOC110044219 isoform X2 [Orbicella faveolata]
MERKLTRFHLFNCDNTYNLNSVEALLLEMEDKLKLKIAVEKHYFRLHQMTEMCETAIPKLQMDVAIFAVHAHESRLSINEENAGIGYGRLYRVLLQAAEGKVLLVIGGDDQYKDEDEEERTVISRWARRKVASQFNEECLDGSESFIFSWNKQHREIHQEALLHYFDPSKKGQKFQYQPKPKPVPLPKPEEPKNTPKEPTGLMDENGTRQRRLNDLDGQTTIDVEPPSFEDYPDGTVLLDTRVLYGKISYKVEDVKIWERGWKPSERAVLDLERKWQSVPVANVQFMANAVGGVYCKVFEVQSPDTGIFSWVKSMIVNCKRTTICTTACILGMIIFGIWRMSTWEQPGGAPDVKLPGPSRV